jgi:hypothetical protein
MPVLHRSPWLAISPRGVLVSGPVEVKVSAAAIASAVSGLGLWALQTYVFRTDVPLPVVAAVTTVVPAIITFLAGYLAPHTPRPDLRCPPEDTSGATSEFTHADLADARGHRLDTTGVVHTGDNPVDNSVGGPVDRSGRHERREA